MLILKTHFNMFVLANQIFKEALKNIDEDDTGIT